MQQLPIIYAYLTVGEKQGEVAEYSDSEDDESCAASSMIFSFMISCSCSCNFKVFLLFSSNLCFSKPPPPLSSFSPVQSSLYLHSLWRRLGHQWQNTPGQSQKSTHCGSGTAFTSLTKASALPSQTLHWSMTLYNTFVSFFLSLRR